MVDLAMGVCGQLGLVHTVSFAYFNLVLKVLCLVVFVYGHLYILQMAFQLQEVYRRYSHIKGYWGEITFAFIYAVFMLGCGLPTRLLLEPLLLVKINTSEYRCSIFMQQFLAVQYDLISFCWPLLVQIFFFCLYFQIVGTQEYSKPEKVNDESFSYGQGTSLQYDQSEYMFGSFHSKVRPDDFDISITSLRPESQRDQLIFKMSVANR